MAGAGGHDLLKSEIFHFNYKFITWKKNNDNDNNKQGQIKEGNYRKRQGVFKTWEQF